MDSKCQKESSSAERIARQCGNCGVCWERTTWRKNTNRNWPKKIRLSYTRVWILTATLPFVSLFCMRERCESRGQRSAVEIVLSFHHVCSDLTASHLAASTFTPGPSHWYPNPNASVPTLGGGRCNSSSLEQHLGWLGSPRNSNMHVRTTQPKTTANVHAVSSLHNWSGWFNIFNLSFFIFPKMVNLILNF